MSLESALKELRALIKVDDAKNAKLLLEQATSLKDIQTFLSTRDRNSHTPLMYCIRKNAVNTLRLMLAAGADVNAIDKEEMTLLACEREMIHIVLLLMKFGANPNIKNQNNTLCHRMSLTQSQQLKLIIKHALEERKLKVKQPPPSPSLAKHPARRKRPSLIIENTEIVYGQGEEESQSPQGEKTLKAPIVNKHIPQQSCQVGQYFQFQFDEDLFLFQEKSYLKVTYQVDDSTLPKNVTFNSALAEFSGKIELEDCQGYNDEKKEETKDYKWSKIYQITISACINSHPLASTGFTLLVYDLYRLKVNDKLQIQPIRAYVGESFSYKLDFLGSGGSEGSEGSGSRCLFYVDTEKEHLKLSYDLTGLPSSLAYNPNNHEIYGTCLKTDCENFYDDINHPKQCTRRYPLRLSCTYYTQTLYKEILLQIIMRGDEEKNQKKNQNQNQNQNILKKKQNTKNAARARLKLLSPRNKAMTPKPNSISSKKIMKPNIPQTTSVKNTTKNKKKDNQYFTFDAGDISNNAGDLNSPAKKNYFKHICNHCKPNKSIEALFLCIHCNQYICLDCEEFLHQKNQLHRRIPLETTLRQQLARTQHDYAGYHPKKGQKILFYEFKDLNGIFFIYQNLSSKIFLFEILKILKFKNLKFFDGKNFQNLKKKIQNFKFF